MKKKLISLAQLALGVGIVAYILVRLDRGGDLGKLALALQSAAGRWPLLVLGSAGFGVCILLCVVRWGLLLRVQGVKLSFLRLWALFLVGQFFNAFILGATGGDVVKAYYVATETQHKRAEVVATVFIDRIIGLLALIVLTLGIMAVRLRFFLSSPAMKLALAFNVMLVGSVLTGFFFVFRRNVWEHWAHLRRLEEKTHFGRVARKAYEAFRLCLRDRAVAVQTLALSLANHLLSVGTVFCLGLALGLKLSFADYLTVFPVINAVAALPITPSGLGTRESASLLLFGALGMPPASAVTLSLLFFCATVLTWSLIGGIVYVFFVLARGRTVPPQPTETY